MNSRRKFDRASTSSTSPSRMRPAGRSARATSWMTPSESTTAATYEPSKSSPTTLREAPFPSRSAKSVAILSAGGAGWLSFSRSLAPTLSRLQEDVLVDPDEVRAHQKGEDPAKGQEWP